MLFVTAIIAATAVSVGAAGSPANTFYGDLHRAAGEIESSGSGSGNGGQAGSRAVNGAASEANIVMDGNTRFTVLTDTLVSGVSGAGRR